MIGRCYAALVALMLGASAATAQTLPPFQASGPFAGSVAGSTATAEPLPLTLPDALERGLRFNLGIIALEEQVESARGARMRSLRALMPHLDVRVDEVRQTRNLAAFGFNPSLFPGLSAVVGPFNVFDARVYGSQALVDISARNDVRSNTAALNAAQLDSENARDVVTFVVTNLYFQAVAGARRIETTRSQVATAEALLTLATNMRNAGASPGIDVVRAQVQLQAQRQRLISAENTFAKQALQLGRAIGLPAAQRIELVDRDATVPASPLALEDALQHAAGTRADYRASLERVHAAEAGLRAASAEALPSVHVSADYGTIGSTPANARGTYAIAGAVRLSLFDNGRKGRDVENAARLRQRQAEAADFAQRVEAEVRTAFLDVQASEQQADVARERVALAQQELSLAQTRFSAGVTSNLEVIQAQDQVALASEVEIAAAYAVNVAKAELARALGD
jgi:outer membrane protein TolC